MFLTCQTERDRHVAKICFVLCKFIFAIKGLSWCLWTVAKREGPRVTLSHDGGFFCPLRWELCRWETGTHTTHVNICRSTCGRAEAALHMAHGEHVSGDRESWTPGSKVPRWQNSDRQLRDHQDVSGWHHQDVYVSESHHFYVSRSKTVL